MVTDYECSYTIFGLNKFPNKFLMYGPVRDNKLLVSCLIQNYNPQYGSNRAPMVIDDHIKLFDKKFVDMVMSNFNGNIIIFPNTKLYEISHVVKLCKNMNFNSYVICVSDRYVPQNILNMFNCVLNFEYSDKGLIKKIIRESIALYDDFMISNPDVRGHSTHKKCQIDNYEDKIDIFADNLQNCNISPIVLKKYIIKHIANVDSIFENYMELIER